MRVLHFDLPEHAPNARALGYACGLATGMASPNYPPNALPPEAPVQAAGPISTNDAAQFGKLFVEGHELGLGFGRIAANPLAKVLAQVPVDLWWPIYMAFAAMQMKMPGESSDERVRECVGAFSRIYKQHLLRIGGTFFID